MDERILNSLRHLVETRLPVIAKCSPQWKHRLAHALIEVSVLSPTTWQQKPQDNLRLFSFSAT